MSHSNKGASKGGRDGGKKKPDQKEDQESELEDQEEHQEDHQEENPEDEDPENSDPPSPSAGKESDFSIPSIFDEARLREQPSRAARRQFTWLENDMMSKLVAALAVIEPCG